MRKRKTQKNEIFIKLYGSIWRWYCMKESLAKAYGRICKDFADSSQNLQIMVGQEFSNTSCSIMVYRQSFDLHLLCWKFRTLYGG
jgi:hypothetical protein